ncbi:fumarylacetoacetate hydrolase family protein [Bacillus carboniphilus]|uniref:Fumarylacetoacetate hydrolase family protein n=1 Tax=Bacillus carboniphilus TaxID=86663 RepID=A0ABY9JXC0_9BACI|nr:fumarylacetoacetate hydrolase family protein [Bacillus carboniphilus]WLR43080.1 fumarylacetoacetate hydrolase family protein [Bacillus carboniphilus]
MKFVTFLNQEDRQVAGVIKGESVIDLHQRSGGKIPSSMLAILGEYHRFRPLISAIQQSAQPSQGSYHLNEVQLLAPLPNPLSLRDFYAFEEHVVNAREKRGLTVVPEWYEIPAFYFSNHLAIKGPNDNIQIPPHCHQFDYELEIACVIGKEGKDIKAENADDYILGYCIMNDWSARDLQRKEMKIGLGPAKGKDFATSIGPYLVTKDELEEFKIGSRYDLKMTASVNGKILSEGNFQSVFYTFPEMIERACTGVTLYPGEVIGSGTLGTGCLLEIGDDTWLQSGDEVTLEITGLGRLVNRVIG